MTVKPTWGAGESRQQYHERLAAWNVADAPEVPAEPEDAPENLDDDAGDAEVDA